MARAKSRQFLPFGLALLYVLCGCGSKPLHQMNEPAITTPELKRIIENAINAKVTLDGNGGHNVYFGIFRSIDNGFTENDATKVLDSIVDSFRDHDDLSISKIPGGVIISTKSVSKTRVGNFGASIDSDQDGSIIVTFCIY